MSGEDYSDWGTVDGEDRAPRSTPASSTRSRGAAASLLPDYPSPPDPCVYRGVVGKLVQALAPHTEADPVGILVQALAAFGNVVGRAPHVRVEATKHHTNLFAVLVGTSSKARKGTGWGHAKDALTSADITWRVQSGLISGEGLIHHVRDASATGDGDAGVQDKRLFVVEPEFAKVLRGAEREGNTLSPVLREAWDSGTLATLTKNSPSTATNAHVSLIGHITVDELRRYLTATESANGFGNRFLWVCAKRAQYLPDGGSPDETMLGEIRAELRLAVEHVKGVGECRRDTRAAERWRAVYRDLSEGQPGLLGSMTGRAEAQVTRLAMLYALTDGQPEIEREHLVAALALWRYCYESARYIFGNSLGDKVADDIRAALVDAAPDGLTRTEISHLFRNNRNRVDIHRALHRLTEAGVARSEFDNTGAGRPVERWFSVEGTN